MKELIMNMTKSMNRFAVVAGLALAVALMSPGSAHGQGKGASQLMPLKSLKTVDDLQAVDKGDKLVMTCPKCKDTYVTTVEKSFKGMNHEELKTAVVHLCPACETKIVAVGPGKAKKETLVHICKSCGSKDVSCCVMKKDDGETSGMEEKK
jgi:predicted RNA-binding Zn-ribbon protein involved in translation (DUF1610 family)